MKKKLAYGMLAGLLVLCLTSCATTKGLSQSKVKKALKDGVWASPENSALFFTPHGNFDSVIQQNPKFGYKFYKLSGRQETISPFGLFTIVTGEVSFSEPLPVGSELKVFSETRVYTVKGPNGLPETRTETTYYGIAGVDAVLNKPGLIFMAYTEKDTKKELKSLKMLYKYFEGTDSAWEHVIADRIEELKNAKK